MAALPVTPQVIKIVFIQSVPGNANVMNRLYYQYAGTAPTVAEMQQLAQNAHTEFMNSLGGVMPTQFYLEEVRAVDLTNDTNPEVSYAASRPGSIAGTLLPPSECALVNYTVNRRYRGGHPRWYQSGLIESNVAETGELVQPWAGEYKTQHDVMLNNVGATGWTGRTAWHHSNVSFYSGFTNILTAGKRAKVVSNPRSSPKIDTVVGTSLFPRVASQRRRILV